MVSVRAHFALLATGLFIISGCGKGADYKSAPDAASESAAGHEYPRNIAATEDAESEEGTGPGQGGDKYDLIVENPFLAAEQNPLSTFSIDVDTASYSKTRMFLLDHQRLPPADAVRIEELVNYFNYDYAGPEDEHPFAANVEIAQCPWKP